MNIFQRFISWVLGWFIIPAEAEEAKPKKQRKATPDLCEFKGCKTKLNLANAYYCSYCDKWHCESHRLPEAHNCKGDLKSHSEDLRTAYSRGAVYTR